MHTSLRKVWYFSSLRKNFAWIFVLHKQKNPYSIQLWVFFILLLQSVLYCQIQCRLFNMNRFFDIYCYSPTLSAAYYELYIRLGYYFSQRRSETAAWHYAFSNLFIIHGTLQQLMRLTLRKLFSFRHNVAVINLFSVVHRNFLHSNSAWLWHARIHSYSTIY